MSSIDLAKFKAIISDFDGTLVGSDFQVSKGVKEAINKWQSLGNKFSILTAKQFQGPVESAYKALNLSGPIAINSGARIINPKTRKIFYEEFIPNDIVNQIVNILNKTNFFYEIQDSQNVYTKYRELNKIQPHKNYKDLENFRIDKILKVRMVTTGRTQEALTFVNTNIENNFPTVNIAQGNTPYSTGIDFTSEKASKHFAVLRLAKILDITPDKIIGIGDGINDYPLLTACGYKVAMDDSPRELIEIADLVVPSHKNDGVAVLINKFIEN